MTAEGGITTPVCALVRNDSRGGGLPHQCADSYAPRAAFGGCATHGLRAHGSQRHGVMSGGSKPPPYNRIFLSGRRGIGILGVVGDERREQAPALR